MNMNVPRSKIALIIDSLYGGGAEKVVLTLARTMNGFGHDAHVIALENVEHYDVTAERNIHHLPGGGKNALGLRAYGRQARQLERLLAQLEGADGRRFDLVVANLEVAYNVVARCRLANVYNCVQISVEEFLRQARRRSLLHYLRRSRRFRVLDGKHLITVSRGLQREIETSGRIRPAAIRTIHNPVEIDAIRRLARQEISGIPDCEYLIHVGRVARQKRHDLLFQALRQVPERYKLVLLANKDEKLRRMAADCGVGSRVIIPGFQQNPYPWIGRARLMVLSSDFEGFPLVMLEALACGTPVVATDCPHGPNELLTGDLARWLVPPGDPTALAAKINEALATDIDVSDAEVLGKVDADHVAEQYLALARPPL
ncbi:MAG: glycosyltransferase [Thermoanaerobaculales bacterium]